MTLPLTCSLLLQHGTCPTCRHSFLDVRPLSESDYGTSDGDYSPGEEEEEEEEEEEDTVKARTSKDEPEKEKPVVEQEDPTMRDLRFNLIALAKRVPLDKFAMNRTQEAAKPFTSPLEPRTIAT